MSRNFQVQIDNFSLSSSTSSVFDPSQNASENSEIFGIFKKFQTFSPFNCGAPRRIPRVICQIITVLAALSMIFRAYWMIFEIDSGFLKFGWAESKMYGFLSFESLILTVALFRVTQNHSLERFEKNLKTLKFLRINKEAHKKLDDYRILKIRIFVGVTFTFVSFALTAVWLVTHKEAIFENEKPSSWYWIYDPIVAILCGYSNFLYLPTHSLLHHAMSRELEVFNEELLEVSKERKLANSVTLRTFAYRQQKLFEFTNFMTGRMERLMNSTPFFSLLAFLMGTFIISEYSKTPPTLYLICIIAMTISTFIISFNLLYPVAFVQESMLATPRILLNDAVIQNSDDPVVYQTYRILMDRALHNRSTNNVLRVFTVNLKNIERVFAFHSLALVFMSVTIGFEKGLEEGFGEIGTLLGKIVQAHS